MSEIIEPLGAPTRFGVSVHFSAHRTNDGFAVSTAASRMRERTMGEFMLLGVLAPPSRPFPSPHVVAVLLSY